MRRQHGFTLIETLITVLIVGILAATGLAVYNGQRARAHDHAAQSDLELGYRALRHAYTGEDLPASGLAAELTAIEPSGAFADGSSYTEDQVQIARTSNTQAVLRTRSRSGASLLLALDTETGQTVRTRSTSDSTLQPLTNLIRNPSAETGVSTWSAYTGNGQTASLTQTSAWAAAGRYSFLLDSSSAAATGTVHSLYFHVPSMLPATEGTKYTCRARVNVITDAGSGASCWLWFFGAGATYLAGTVTPFPGTGEKTISATMQAPAGTVTVRTGVGFWKTDSGYTGRMYVDAIAVTATDGPVAYFDGDTPAGTWTGTAHNSASTGYPDGEVLGP